MFCTFLLPSFFFHLCTRLPFSLLFVYAYIFLSETLHVTKVALHAVLLTASLHLNGRALLEKFNIFNNPKTVEGTFAFLNLFVLHLVRTKKPCLSTAYSIIVMNSIAQMVLFKVNSRIYKKPLKHESIRHREIKVIFCFYIMFT